MIAPPSLPHDPGCYLFSDGEGAILYVGKAKDLKKRVASYFRKSGHDQKTGMMLGAAAGLDFIVTGSEVEALILENSLIKKHQPRFNINLRDAKQYAYIQLTAEPFPAVRIARRAAGEGSFFGPFVSAAERDYVRDVVRKTFRLRTCRKLPKRACLRYHIHTCSAPCIGEVTQDRYDEAVRKASLVLKGRTGELLASLREEMGSAAASEQFEHAMHLRDQIRALERLSERQDIARRKEGDEDIINYAVHSGTVHLMLFNVYRGTLGNKSEYTFDGHPDFLEEFLVQYYSDNPVPAELILPEEPGDSLAEFLSVKRGKKVTVTVPKIGAKRRLLDLVARNIEAVFLGGQAKILELQEALTLDSPPSVIECFDISHLSGSSVVGSMVRFRDGRPDKKNYRRFRIRTVEGIDDPASIAEVVRRRYTRLVREGGDLPDLILIDGGRIQMQAAQRELNALGLGVPVIALAKKNEEIFVPGRARPLPLSRKEKGSLYLQEIRDEAHRFAIAYHRLLRKKEMTA
ncbi:MAG: excinuclease ABC subunit C [Methanomicrobiales archaeon]|nr:excinuclease ABC subunit C [Methanomicrobiales archaeon]NYT21770.1 excinuclease ABC subunit C [Methanomicrobiales archaeon]